MYKNFVNEFQSTIAVDFSILKKIVEQYSFISEDEWHAFTEAAKIKHLKKNEYLLEPGLKCNSLYFILSGSIRLGYRTDKGKEIATKFVFEEQFTTALSSFITQEPSNESIVASEDSMLLIITYIDFHVLLLKYPNWERIARILTEKSYLQTVQREQLLLEKPKDRYVKFSNVEKKVTQRIEQKHIASYLGMTPETLSRIKRKVLIPSP